MDAELIRAKIRHKLRTGDLPERHLLVLAIGPGTGKRCNACDREIYPSDVQCQCDLAVGGGVWFHKTCFALWKRVLRG